MNEKKARKIRKEVYGELVSGLVGRTYARDYSKECTIADEKRQLYKKAKKQINKFQGNYHEIAISSY